MLKRNTYSYRYKYSKKNILNVGKLRIIKKIVVKNIFVSGKNHPKKVGFIQNMKIQWKENS